MISHVVVKNWKAYKILDLELGPGTTFIVSPNGVGKTSLLEAIRWGLLGPDSGVDAPAARRGDEVATVSLGLRLLADMSVELTRTLSLPDSRGVCRELLEANVTDAAGTVTSVSGDDAWSAFLLEQWRAAPSLLSRLVAVPEDAIYQEIQSPTSFYVVPHVLRSLNLDVLEVARDRADNARRRASDASSRFRATVRAQARSTAELQELREQQARELEGLEPKLEAVREERARRQRLADLRASWSALQLEHQAYARDQQILRRELDTAGFAVAQADMGGLLRSTLEQVVQRRRALRDREVILRSQLASEARHLDLLRSGHGDCPTCLRPLDDHGIQTAIETHQQNMASLEHNASQATEGEDGLRIEEARVREWLDRVSRPAPSPLPESPKELSVDSHPEEDAVDDGLMEQESHLAERMGQLRYSIGQVDRDLEQVSRAAAEEAEASQLYREEALAELLRDALRFTTDRLTHAAVDPLTTAVTSQLKRSLELGSLLQMGDDGAIEASRGGRIIAFSGLSGGEKAFALLVHRVVTLRMLSAASFLLLDEPLERLDPRNRLTMARLISNATGPSKMTQILVTTYEEGLVRSLIEDERRRAHLGADGRSRISMLHVRASSVTEDA